MTVRCFGSAAFTEHRSMVTAAALFVAASEEVFHAL
jgi:hypothetical protein